FITQRERSELSDAYRFLRTLEHRLQMEHGLQTHTVLENDEAQSLVARRMGFAGARDFLDALKTHTTNVRNTYNRLFAEVEKPADVTVSDDNTRDSSTGVRLAMECARVFAQRMDQTWQGKLNTLANLLLSSAGKSLNPHRALLQLLRITASLAKTDRRMLLTHSNL